MSNLKILDFNKPELSPDELRNLFKTYSSISIKFVINGEYNLSQDDSANWKMEFTSKEDKEKNYDDFENPLSWLQTWDTTNWGIVLAYDGNNIVGGAIIVWNTVGVNMLEGKEDRAVLWDIRVNEDYRGNGVGRSLFEFSEQWAKERKCTEMIIETQTNNIKAMDFYLKMGGKIYKVDKNAYPNMPNEVQVIFRKQLSEN